MSDDDRNATGTPPPDSDKGSIPDATSSGPPKRRGLYEDEPGYADPSPGSQHSQSDQHAEQDNPDNQRSDGKDNFRFHDSQPSTSSSADGQTCLMMGTVNSGKTFLLLAFERACHMPANDDLELGFVPEESVTKLMENGVEIITGEKKMLATGEANDYSFEIRVKAALPNLWGRKKPIHTVLNMTFSDGPGGALFTEEADQANRASVERWQPKLVASARRATSLIFCVDATDPKLSLLGKRLPGLIAKMTLQQSTAETEEPSLWGRLQRRPPQVNFFQRRCLNVDRFLILLTKVDQLCAPHPKPRLMATLMDPIAQIKETLSVYLLKSLQSTLKPNAQFAVGVTSALGFNPVNGRPLADQYGVPRKTSTDDKDEIYRRWTPFGIRDAIFFIATGQALGSVKLITPADLKYTEAEPVDVDPYSPDQP